MTDSKEQPQSLWKLTGQAPGTPEPDSCADSSGDQPQQTCQPPAESKPEAKPKGLWETMGHRTSADESSNQGDRAGIDGESEAEPAAAEAPVPLEGQPESTEDPDVSRPKGLWAVMGSSAGAPSRPEKATGSATNEEPSTPEGDGGTPGDELSESALASEEAGQDGLAFLPAGDEEAPIRRKLEVKSGRSGNALASCALGLAALLFSFLAMLPDVWAKLPAPLAGFGALILGLMAWQEIHRSRGRIVGKELAAVGVVLGVLAMFLGPLVFARLGRGHRESSGRRQTVANLEAIGQAVLAYHERHNRFPAGAIYRVGADGNRVAMHSWMSGLLPHLGNEELYRSIEFDRPFDHQVNLPAMRVKVSEFFAGGQNRKTSGAKGLAAAHYAGLGGRINVEGLGVANAGIFGPNSNVNRNDVTDGLSQTLIAGEISYGIPPWGEPGNWRTVGRGLCADPAGFGNADGTGALFLKADGSVRFFSKKTSIGVLERLSTRDAGDAAPQR